MSEPTDVTPSRPCTCGATPRATPRGTFALYLPTVRALVVVETAADLAVHAVEVAPRGVPADRVLDRAGWTRGRLWTSRSWGEIVEVSPSLA